MTVDKRQYDAFVDSSPQGSMFHKSWWLDAVAPGKYEILVIQENKEILAAWPLVFKKVIGLNIILQPLLTPSLGIMFKAFDNLKYSEQLSIELKLMLRLLSQVPRHCFFYQRFQRDFTNWLPLYWDNYEQTTRYTYVIEDLTDEDQIWENIRSSTRRKIKKALQQGIRVVKMPGLEKFLDLNELTYQRQGLPLPYSREYVKRIDESCLKYGAREIIFAVDIHGSIHAAAYIVFDNKSAYYLMGGGEPSLRNSNAQAVVLWEAIKFASEVSKSFDFEGTMHKNIEPIFRGFGAKQKPYMEITKGSPLLRLGFRAFKQGWDKGGLMANLCSKFLD